MVNFGPLTPEIYWRVWGTQANFNGFHVLAALLNAANGSGRQPNFAALNRKRHQYSAGRPSRWALAHILLLFVSGPFVRLWFKLEREKYHKWTRRRRSAGRAVWRRSEWSSSGPDGPDDCRRSSTWRTGRRRASERSRRRSRRRRIVVGGSRAAESPHHRGTAAPRTWTSTSLSTVATCFLSASQHQGIVE